MATPPNPDPVRGRTIRFAWTEGPTQGSTHEHVFHADGTVEWQPVDDAHGAPDGASDHTPRQRERPPYFVASLREDLCLASYLSRSGFTLSVALDFAEGSIVGVASSDRQWFPVRGRLEIIS